MTPNLAGTHDCWKRPTGVLGEELSGEAAEDIFHKHTERCDNLPDVTSNLKMQKGSPIGAALDCNYIQVRSGTAVPP
jgi:hypothetical protein